MPAVISNPAKTCTLDMIHSKLRITVSQNIYQTPSPNFPLMLDGYFWQVHLHIFLWSQITFITQQLTWKYALVLKFRYVCEKKKWSKHFFPWSWIHSIHTTLWVGMVPQNCWVQFLVLEWISSIITLCGWEHVRNSSWTLAGLVLGLNSFIKRVTTCQQRWLK